MKHQSRVPTQQVEVGGRIFEIPAGYDSIEDYAVTLLFYLRHQKRLRMTPEQVAEYEDVIRQLREAGL